jgi:hypothetical protein
VSFPEITSKRPLVLWGNQFQRRQYSHQKTHPPTHIHIHTHTHTHHTRTHTHTHTHTHTRTHTHTNSKCYILTPIVWITLPLTSSYILSFTSVIGDRGSTVVNVLCYKSEGRWFDTRWCHGIFNWHKSFRSHYGYGGRLSSNRNEYREYFLGVNAAGA